MGQYKASIGGSGGNNNTYKFDQIPREMKFYNIRMNVYLYNNYNDTQII